VVIVQVPVPSSSPTNVTASSPTTVDSSSTATASAGGPVLDLSHTSVDVVFAPHSKRTTTFGDIGVEANSGNVVNLPESKVVVICVGGSDDGKAVFQATAVPLGEAHPVSVVYANLPDRYGLTNGHVYVAEVATPGPDDISLDKKPGPDDVKLVVEDDDPDAQSGTKFDDE